MDQELKRQIFDDLTNAGFILDHVATSPDDFERAMRVMDESVRKFAANQSEDPAWSELTQLQRMKFGTEEEYLAHCVKWNSDPDYRESNPYTA